MRTYFLKYTSLIMLMVVFTISVAGFCRSAHSAEASVSDYSSNDACYYSDIEKGCPCGPIDDHAVPDHCDSACNCPCHAPLTLQPVRVVCAQEISPLLFSEPFKATPEVFLSKFIPPQIHA